MIDWDDKYARDGLTFDDVLLVPAESEVLPSETEAAATTTEQIRALRARLAELLDPVRRPGCRPRARGEEAVIRNEDGF